MSNAQSGATYEAILVDQITAPANQIIQTLARLDAAFKGVHTPSAAFAQNMQTIGAVMRDAGRGSKISEQGTNLGMVFNRLSEVSSQMGSSIGRAIGGIGIAMERMGLAAIAMSGVVVYALADIVKSASDAVEILNAFNVVMETNTRIGKEAAQWADDFAESVGRSSTQTKRAMVSFQGFWKGLGASQRTAVGMTKTMTQLSTDFGSFFNLSDKESSTRMIQALSGSAEVLDQFGVNIREAALEVKGLEVGFGGNVRKMTEYQKALLRASIIMDVLKNKIGAVGDAVRTKLDWANMMRTASAGLEDLKIALGGLIIKELRGYLQAVTSALGSLKEAAMGLSAVDIRQFLSSILVFGGIAASAVALGVALATLGGAISVASLAFAGFLTSIGAIVAGGPIAAAVAGLLALVAAAGAMTAVFAVGSFPWVAAFEELKVILGSIVDDVTKVADIIKDAIIAEDWASAWEGLVITGKLAALKISVYFIDMMATAIESVITRAAEAALKLSRIAGGALMGGAVGAGAAASAAGGLANEANRIPIALDFNTSILELEKQLRALRAKVPVPPEAKPGGIADSIKNLTGLDVALQMEQAWKKIQDSATFVKDAFAAAKKHTDDMKEAANKWADSMLSPGDKFIDELKQIELFRQMNVGGRVTPEMVQNAQNAAAETLLKDLPKTRFQASSVGTQSRVIADRIGQFAPAFDEQLTELKKQTRIQDLINQGINQLNTAKAVFK